MKKYLIRIFMEIPVLDVLENKTKICKKLSSSLHLGKSGQCWY